MNSEIPEVIFLKLGGTWDMVSKKGLIGSGNLDDAELLEIEKHFDGDEKNLLQKIAEKIYLYSKETKPLSEQLGWVQNINSLVSGQFISLFSGDSSHLRNVLIAPIIACILKFANLYPEKHIVGALGTDTADIAMLPILDVYTFDTELLPILFTGANRSHHEWNSDAPKNFSDLFHLVHAHLPTGVYWVFASHLYRASDMVKIDPLETRRIENYSTFFSPRLTARHVKKVVGENNVFYTEQGISPDQSHISKKTNTKRLYDAMNEVYTVDLSNQNSVDEEIEKILDSKHKAIIIATHSLGNVSNPIRFACQKAAEDGKLIFIVSRSLIGEVNERYAASLLRANTDYLLSKGKQLISGYKLNKSVARALAIRALDENLSQQQTQELVNIYCQSRGLFS